MSDIDEELSPRNKAIILSILTSLVQARINEEDVGQLMAGIASVLIYFATEEGGWSRDRLHDFFRMAVEETLGKDTIQ